MNFDEFLAVAGQSKLKKMLIFFHSFSFHTKDFSLFCYLETSLILIFCQPMVEQLLASEALHIGPIGKITKPLQILYHLIKLFLNFG